MPRMSQQIEVQIKSETPRHSGRQAARISIPRGRPEAEPGAAAILQCRILCLWNLSLSRAPSCPIASLAVSALVGPRVTGRR